MSKSLVPNLDDLSLTNSGLFYQLINRIGLGKSTQRGYLTRSLSISGLTWIPLLALTLMQGLAFGERVEITFIKDIATHARYLIIIPLLIFAEASVDSRIRELTAQFFKSGILNNKHFEQFEEIKKNTTKLTHSISVDLVILVGIVFIIIAKWNRAPEDLSYWMHDPATGMISWAGIWNVFISLPLFQFILVRWLWRWICWLYYFFRISRLPLHLNPAHPDLSGGLGFLGLPPSPFMAVNFALATLVSAVVAERILFMNQHLADFYITMGTLTVITILMNVLPLLVFMTALAAARRKGIFEYSALVQKHHQQFDNKLLHADQDEPLVGNPAASSMADINASFDTVMKMRVFPFDLKIMASTIIIMILPVLPLLAFEYNVVDLLKKLAGLLF
jgi:hypothetical protein